MVLNKEKWLLVLISILLIIALTGCSNSGGDTDINNTSQFKLNVIVSPENGGIVNINPKKSTYSKNDKITITAEPNDKWEFSHWEGISNINLANNPYNLVMDNDYTVKAVFKDIPSQIVFVGSGFDAYDELFTINSDGTNKNQLTDDSVDQHTHPAWSPDGSEIAYEFRNGSTNYGIRVMNKNGSNDHQVIPGEYGPHNPTWSPNGKKIAFDSEWIEAGGQHKIYVTEVSNCDPIPVIDVDYNQYNPDWSPDREKITFVGDVLSGEEIFVVNLNTGDITQLTSNGNNNSPDWSPNGNKIVYEHNKDIYIMNSDGSNQNNLTNNEIVEFTPSWSPDGSMIVYERHANIYIMNSDGSDNKPLYVNENNYSGQPSWGSNK